MSLKITIFLIATLMEEIMPVVTMKKEFDQSDLPKLITFMALAQYQNSDPTTKADLIPKKGCAAKRIGLRVMP